MLHDNKLVIEKLILILEHWIDDSGSLLYRWHPVETSLCVSCFPYTDPHILVTSVHSWRARSYFGSRSRIERMTRGVKKQGPSHSGWKRSKVQHIHCHGHKAQTGLPEKPGGTGLIIVSASSTLGRCAAVYAPAHTYYTFVFVLCQTNKGEKNRLCIIYWSVMTAQCYCVSRLHDDLHPEKITLRPTVYSAFINNQYAWLLAVWSFFYVDEWTGFPPECNIITACFTVAACPLHPSCLFTA